MDYCVLAYPAIVTASETRQQVDDANHGNSGPFHSLCVAPPQLHVADYLRLPDGYDEDHGRCGSTCASDTRNRRRHRKVNSVRSLRRIGGVPSPDVESAE